jgi:hypothetical protein
MKNGEFNVKKIEKLLVGKIKFMGSGLGDSDCINSGI